ncbi:MAG: hypothetical protein IK101_04285 [Oscillospiraceae bacterium]|nr:hypothetical protein [Oscillospiraceae bacterium]
MQIPLTLPELPEGLRALASVIYGTFRMLAGGVVPQAAAWMLSREWGAYAFALTVAVADAAVLLTLKGKPLLRDTAVFLLSAAETALLTELMTWEWGSGAGPAILPAALVLAAALTAMKAADLLKGERPAGR